ncbi:hypothetical protein ACQPXH_02610 [Nocardia sp. CA-135953]|uniref:hypothetical protein n=1 Tax=Nocardia sp. CA-135953 TaxID=3239978 RepID=UPI003D95FDF7
MPIGRVIAVLIVNWSQIPGSGRTGPNPVSSPSPTQPDQIATNAGRASSRTGHARGTLRTGFVSAGALWCAGLSLRTGTCSVRVVSCALAVARPGM